MTWHIANTFDIFRGAVAERESDGETSYDITQGVTIHDVTNRRVYFRTHESICIRVVGLARLDFSGDGIKTIVLHQPEAFEDATEQMA